VVDVVGNGRTGIFDVAKVNARRLFGTGEETTGPATSLGAVQAGDVNAPHSHSTNADAADVADKLSINMDRVSAAKVAAEFDFVSHRLFISR